MSHDDQYSAPYVDPEAGRAFRELEQAMFGGSWPVLTAEGISEARAMSGAHFSLEAAIAGRAIAHEERTVPGGDGEPPLTVSVFGVGVRGDARPAVYSIHGGGMVSGSRFGDLDLHAVEEIGAVVVSPEYRLAPEHPHPAPHDDCYRGLRWMFDHGDDLGIDRDRVVIVGHSAGGGLAAGVVLRARDEGGPRIAGQQLVFPMLDDRNDSLSVRRHRRVGVWGAEENEVGWRALLAACHGTDAVPAYAAPARATDLAGLPPTYLDVGSADLFRDEVVAYASGLWAAGGAATLHVWPGAFHGSEFFAPRSPVTLDATAARRSWLLRVLSAPPVDEPRRSAEATRARPVQQSS